MYMISICCMHFGWVYSTNKHKSSARHTSLQQMAQSSPIATGLTNSHTPSLCFVSPPAVPNKPCSVPLAVESESCGKASVLSLSHLYINCDGDSVLTVNRLPPESSRNCHFLISENQLWSHWLHRYARAHSCMSSFIKSQYPHVCKYKLHKFHHLWNVHYFSVTRQSRKWERQWWEMMWKQWSSRIHGHIITFSSKGKALLPTAAKKKKKKKPYQEVRWHVHIMRKRKYIWMLTTCEQVRVVLQGMWVEWIKDMCVLIRAWMKETSCECVRPWAAVVGVSLLPFLSWLSPAPLEAEASPDERDTIERQNEMQIERHQPAHLN